MTPGRDPFAHRRAAREEADDLVWRYGPGAAGIARDRAVAAVDPTERRHLRLVARLVEQRGSSAARPAFAARG